MIPKRPSDLTDEEVRQLLTYLLGKQQDLEVHLAATIAVLLHHLNRVTDPQQGEWEDTIGMLLEFLKEAGLHIRAINTVSDMFGEPSPN